MKVFPVRWRYWFWFWFWSWYYLWKSGREKKVPENKKRESICWLWALDYCWNQPYSINRGPLSSSNSDSSALKHLIVWLKCSGEFPFVQIAHELLHVEHLALIICCITFCASLQGSIRRFRRCIGETRGFGKGTFFFMIFFFFICLAKHCACCVGNKPAVIITIRGLIGRVVDFIIYPGSFIYCIYIYIYFSGQNFDIMHNRRQRKNTDGYAELPQKGTFLDTQTQTEIRKQIYIYTPTQTLTGIRLFTTQTRNRRNLTQRRKRWAAHTDTMTQRWGLETVSTVSDTDAMAEWQM